VRPICFKVFKISNQLCLRLLVLQDERTVLLLTPVARHFFGVGSGYQDDDLLELKGVHIANLIEVLHCAHKKHVIHRDVKLANFFCNPVDEKKILLNDWSCACINPTKEPFIGTYLYTPNELLQGIVDNGSDFRYTPEPKHDLESAVKCLYLSMHPFIVNKVNLNKPEHVINMWKDRLGHGVWQEMMLDVEKCDYENLKLKVSRLY